MLTWSQQPRVLADRQSVMRHLVARVCRNISSTSSRASSSTTTCAQPVGEVDPQKTAGAIASAARGKSNSEIAVRFTDTLSDLEGRDPVQFAVYTVEVRDDRGRSAGFSNPVSVPLLRTLPARGLHSELDVHGVYLIWENDIESRPSSLQFDYRIYRREKNDPKVAISYLRAVVHTREGDRWSGVDTNIEWGKTYSYWIAPVTRLYSESGQLLAELEGEDSAPLEVTTHDVFAPAVPERLLAVPSNIPGKKFVDLVWAPNTEKDLAGYNVYRREEGGRTARINSAPITMLSFQDTDIAAGHNYFYCLSAVDIRGNESAKSSEIAAGLP